MNESDLKNPSGLVRRFNRIIGLLVVLLSIYMIVDIFSSNTLFFKNPEYLALRAKNGNYVCCDINKGGIMVADRKEVINWEEFSAEKKGGGYFALLSS